MPRRRPPVITQPRHPDITPRISTVSITGLELTAGAPIAPVIPRRRWLPYAWPAAVLLHVIVIAILLLLLRHRAPEDALEPTGVQVVYEPGAAASQTPHQSPVTTPAQSPPAPAPAQTAEAAPEVNLNLPDNALAPPAPSPPPQRQVAAPARRAPPRPPQKYTVMNDMSLGNGPPSPAFPHAQPGLNLSLPQSDSEAANTPEITIKGQVGADWRAGFNKWVYAHLYYPDAAAAQGQQGYVTVQFTAHRDGSVTGLHMLESSGSPFLDQGWTGIFAQNRLPPFPPGGSDTLQITARVHYMIEP